MSNLGTVIRMPYPLLYKSAPIIKFQRPAFEVPYKSDSGISNVTPIPMMLTLLVVDKLIEGNGIKFEVR